MFEERFYQRWDKARKKGFLVNVVLEGIRSFFTIIIVVCLSQLFAHGRTPMDLVSGLPNSVLIGIFLFIIVLNILIGIATWYENEKRYKRIHHGRQYADF